MNAALKTKWVAALRSGEYTQNTDGYLRREGSQFVSYCCLGVLCHLIDPSRDKDITGKEEVLPEWAMLAAGLSTDNPELRHGINDCLLSDLNDTSKLPLTLLADLIEEQL